ncbi:phage/plasmid replication domain-containing protein [Heyndrickxia sp. NPDC080065]|uniref:phage/plasmid replication domain-containing protein n=1 Tax=Heyndrickxia sp. NPDC080065 TaxID=3390568 RepID=UPI003D02B20E
MIHTAKFQVLLQEDEIGLLCRKFKEKITLIGNVIDKNFNGISTSFKKLFAIWRMDVYVDFIKLIGKADIQEKDITKIQKSLDEYLYYIFDNNDKELMLLRLDFRFDAAVPNKKHRDFLLKIYKKTVEKYGFKKKNDHYKSTIYFNSKSMKVMIYDKETEREKKGEKIQEYEKDVLRFEVSLQNRHLNYMKRTYGLDKRLENYLTDEFWTKYMTKNICPIFFKGNYYPISLSEKIIGESNIKERDKSKLREFLCDVSRHGFDRLKGLKVDCNGKEKEKYSKYKIDKYTKILEDLNINPISIAKHDAEQLGKEKWIKNPFMGK